MHIFSPPQWPVASPYRRLRSLLCQFVRQQRNDADPHLQRFCLPQAGTCDKTLKVLSRPGWDVFLPPIRVCYVCMYDVVGCCCSMFTCHRSGSYFFLFDVVHAVDPLHQTRHDGISLSISLSAFKYLFRHWLAAPDSDWLCALCRVPPLVSEL